MALSKSALHSFLVRHNLARKKIARGCRRISILNLLCSVMNMDALLRSPLEETKVAHGISRGHRETRAFVSALHPSGMVMPMVLDRLIKGSSFEAHIESFLVSGVGAKTKATSSSSTATSAQKNEP